MPNRIEATFMKMRAENRAAFIPYICAGDPTLAQTVRIAGALIGAGAVVTHNVAPDSIVAGNPAIVVKTLG